MAYISFQPSDYFSTILYTGDGGASQAQTGVGFSADLTWIKSRDSTEEHVLTDTVRGATYWMRSNAANASAALATGLLSWQSDGFTVGNNGVVGTANDYVAWNWKAGTTSGLSGGTITPSAYSFNATSGFSIVKYTGNATQGATVPHGLGVAPKLIFIKATNAAESWASGQGSMDSSSPWDYYMYLNSTGTRNQNNNRFANVSPTSSVFSIGTDASVNNSSYTYMAYCFAPIKGFSAFGSYEGNSSTDGPFIYTGFRPNMVILKNIDRVEAWNCYDAIRNPSNLTDNPVNLNDTAAEITSATKCIDILSNGFKIKGTSTEINHSTMIYAAFAEFPFVSSNSKAGVAR